MRGGTAGSEWQDPAHLTSSTRAARLRRREQERSRRLQMCSISVRLGSMLRLLLLFREW